MDVWTSGSMDNACDVVVVVLVLVGPQGHSTIDQMGRPHRLDLVGMGQKAVGSLWWLKPVILLLNL